MGHFIKFSQRANGHSYKMEGVDLMSQKIGKNL